jgi:hypothetical protein
MHLQMLGRRHRGGHAECTNGRLVDLMVGIGSRGGNPHGGTLPQRPRFGMNVAQEGI